MIKEVVFIRHGETEYNSKDIAQGQLDTQLTKIGIEQVKKSIQGLSKFKIEKLYSSDLVRAKDTAKIIGRELNLEIFLDRRLRETNLGLWQGISKDELIIKEPKNRELWLKDPEFVPPNGESKMEVTKRFESFFRELNINAEIIGIVTHGGLISAVVPKLLNLPKENWRSFRGIGNASWCSILLNQSDSTWILKTWNPEFENISGLA